MNSPAGTAARGEARPVLAAVQGRRSHSKVTDAAPDTRELGELVSALASVADHSALRPWRLIELRGDDRDALGHGLAEADGGSQQAHDKYVAKARRAPLVLAIVVAPKPSKKVPAWEQEAVAAGAAHTLSLLLHEAGWGVIWRTGLLARTDAVHRAHGLAPHEYLLGWLYVGGVPDRDQKPKPRKPLPLSDMLRTPES